MDSLIILLLLYFTALDQGQNIDYTNKTRVGQARGGTSYLEHLFVQNLCLLTATDQDMMVLDIYDTNLGRAK